MTFLHKDKIENKNYSKTLVLDLIIFRFKMQGGNGCHCLFLWQKVNNKGCQIIGNVRHHEIQFKKHCEQLSEK